MTTRGGACSAAAAGLRAHPARPTAAASRTTAGATRRSARRNPREGGAFMARLFVVAGGAGGPRGEIPAARAGLTAARAQFGVWGFEFGVRRSLLVLNSKLE